MWVKVENLRNLDKALQDATEEYIATKPKKERAKKSELNHIEKQSRKHVLRVICWCFLLILVTAFIVATVIASNASAQRKAISNLTDPRLISYEDQIREVKKVALLFQIYNEDTYQNAMASLKLSDELKAKYFINQHYTGNAAPITVTYKSVLYELTENDSVHYLLIFETEQGTTIRKYRVQVEYYNDELVYINVL